MKRPKLSKGLICRNRDSIFVSRRRTDVIVPVILSAKMDKKREYNQNCKADILRKKVDFARHQHDRNR